MKKPKTAGAIFAELLKAPEHKRAKLLRKFEKQSSKQLDGAEIDLSSLRRESDALLTRMQTSESRAAMEVAFNATPEQLGKAALAAVRKRKRKGEAR